MTQDISTIIESYNNEVKDLPRLHQISGGKARNGSGAIFENLIERICSANGFEAKKNDYKRSEEIDGIILKNLQVDKHIYLNGTLKKLVESKCYLDVCYCKRAVIDFIELYRSPDVPKDVEYAIFCGQRCIKEDALKYYSSYFKRETGKVLNLFVVNTYDQRSNKRPIYKEEYNQDFTLNVNEVNKFVEWLKT